MTKPLGRHLDGCRIGFDLGGSDRKVAAVIDGRVVFSEETVWDPYHKPDPQYHFDGIMDSLRRAAAHLPRVDAIGGSAAGVYVNNRVKRRLAVPRASRRTCSTRASRNMFLDVRKAWNDVPFEVVNDGEVTALAGSMSLGENAVLGIALGTSTAAGYVTPEGNITSWLERARVRARSTTTPDAAARRVVGRLRCRLAVFLAAGRRAPHARCRHRRPRPISACPSAQDGAGALRRGRRARPADLRDHRRLPRIRRRAIRRPSTTSATCWCSAG